jgi:FKBP-type peptidyl-prolyl cis-trans isomerase
MSRRLRCLVPPVLAAALTVGLVACGDDTSSATTTPATDISLVPATTTPVSVPSAKLPASPPTSLEVTKVKEGTGTPAADGDVLVVNYVGVRSADGSQFSTNYGREPIAVTLGLGHVIKGWDQGLVGAKKGERVQLDVPPDLAYGDAPPDTAEDAVIKAGDALTFVVDVLDVIPAPDATKQPTAAQLPASPGEVPEAISTDVTVGTGDTLEAGEHGVFLFVYFDAAKKTVSQTTWPDGAEVITGIKGDVATNPSAGLVGMKVGGRRALTIPAAMARTRSDVVIVADLLSVV